jgi:hypothetical protein
MKKFLLVAIGVCALGTTGCAFHGGGHFTVHPADSWYRAERPRVVRRVERAPVKHVRPVAKKYHRPQESYDSCWCERY